MASQTSRSRPVRPAAICADPCSQYTSSTRAARSGARHTHNYNFRGVCTAHSDKQGEENRHTHITLVRQSFSPQKCIMHTMDTSHPIPCLPPAAQYTAGWRVRAHRALTGVLQQLQDQRLLQGPVPRGQLQQHVVLARSGPPNVVQGVVPVLRQVAGGDTAPAIHGLHKGRHLWGKMWVEYALQPSDRRS